MEITYIDPINEMKNKEIEKEKFVQYLNSKGF